MSESVPVANELESVQSGDVEVAAVCCSSCGAELQIGDYPFCPHGSIYRENAQRFDPIVLHKDPATGEYSFPGHSSDPTPHGMQRIEITDMRTADRYVKEINTMERAKSSDKREMNRLYFEEKNKDRRKRIDSVMKAKGMSGRARMLADMARKFVDQKHDKKFSSTRAFDPNFHIQALSFDRTNRMPYAGKETGYRDRRS